MFQEKNSCNVSNKKSKILYKDYLDLQDYFDLQGRLVVYRR